MVSMHVLVDSRSLWRQRLQHIDIARLSYNAVRHHGTRLPHYKEGRLYLVSMELRWGHAFALLNILPRYYGHLSIKTVVSMELPWGHAFALLNILPRYYGHLSIKVTLAQSQIILPRYYGHLSIKITLAQSQMISIVKIMGRQFLVIRSSPRY